MKYLQVKIEDYITGIKFANEIMGLKVVDDERFMMVLLWRIKAYRLK